MFTNDRKQYSETGALFFLEAIIILLYKMVARYKILPDQEARVRYHKTGHWPKGASLEYYVSHPVLDSTALSRGP